MLLRGLCLLIIVCAGRAVAAQPWDGTWTGGWDGGDGIEIVIAGGKATRVVRGGDHPEILSSEVSPDGSMMCVWWIGGDGLLQRSGDREAAISLREHGRPARSFTIRLDR